MRLRFNKKARKSLADSLKVLSYLAPAGANWLLIPDAIESMRSTLFVIYCVFWIVCQALALLVLAYEDEPRQKNSD